MTLEELFGDVIAAYTLADAIADGNIIRLDVIEFHQRDCAQYYKCPVYITNALYEQHKSAAMTAAENDSEIANSILGATIFDMLNMSVAEGRYKELSDSIRKFKYHLQKDRYTFHEHRIETVSQVGCGDEGEMIVTFMQACEL